MPGSQLNTDSHREDAEARNGPVTAHRGAGDDKPRARASRVDFLGLETVPGKHPESSRDVGVEAPLERLEVAPRRLVARAVDDEERPGDLARLEVAPFPHNRPLLSLLSEAMILH